MECYISNSKLILCEWNAFYFSEIAFTDFTLYEIKQCIVFFGTPGIYINNYLLLYIGRPKTHYVFILRAYI